MNLNLEDRGDEFVSDEHNLRIVADSDAHTNSSYPFEEIHASYVKHLKETGLTADMWCIEIEGKHQIGGLYPYEYAVEVAEDFLNREKS